MYKKINEIGLVLTIVIALLVVKLVSIQVIDCKKYSSNVVKQHFIQISADDGRGNFYDRNNILLTENTYKTEAIVFPDIFLKKNNLQQLNEIEKDIPNISSICSEQKNINKTYITVDAVNITKSLRDKIDNNEFSGIIIYDKPLRYSDNSIAKHIIGYINSEGNGVSGLEKTYNKYLKSNSRKIFYAMVDAKQCIVPCSGYIAGTSSDKREDNVILTIDYNIQNIIENEMNKYIQDGAVVVADAKSGEILGMSSRPDYNQTNINKSGSSLINNCVEAFQPGSLFKTIVLASVLNENKSNENEKFFCNGGIWVDNLFVKCHESQGGLKNINLKQAYAYSCNDTFIKLAQRTGGDNIINMAEKFGFSKTLNIGIQDEKKGSLPNKDMYAGPGICNLAIGQGNVTATPLQVADMISIIVNHGQKNELTLVKGIKDYKGNWVSQVKSSEPQRIINANIADKIMNYMNCVTSFGTGTQANDKSFGYCAGKTGTAALSNKDTNAWFAGYFPQNSPKYIIVVFKNKAVSGGTDCCPVFKDIALKINELENKFNTAK